MSPQYSWVYPTVPWQGRPGCPPKRVMIQRGNQLKPHLSFSKHEGNKSTSILPNNLTSSQSWWSTEGGDRGGGLRNTYPNSLGVRIRRGRYWHSHLSQVPCLSDLPDDQGLIISPRAWWRWPDPCHIPTPGWGRPVNSRAEMGWHGSSQKPNEPPWWFSQDGASILFSIARHVLMSPLIQLSASLQGWDVSWAHGHTREHPHTHAYMCIPTCTQYMDYTRLSTLQGLV